MSKPIVAVVGRPNVGKSTLFNSLCGQQISIVKDTPGVTRDRIYAEVSWLNHNFTLIDTGGIEPDTGDIILSQMREQAEIAIETADVIIFMTDVKQGLVDSDSKVADMLRRSHKPVILVVNKVDSFEKMMPDVYEFYNLGIGEPFPISAVNKLGFGEVLDEVVVIGYGSVKRKDVTTAISSVSTKDLDMRPIVSAGQAIQGKAAGVSVIQPNGTPGGEMSIRVRGTTSMNGSNDPLYVVDGVPVDNIKFLSPNDIESMQILKDASSASIYGSRAANGVILITTKAGAAGNAKVSLTAQFGLNKVADKVESLNAAQYKELQDEIGLVSLPDGLPDRTDWFDETYTTGKTQNYQVAVSNGNEKMKYYLSAGYLKEQGVLDISYYKRYNFRVNLENQVRKWLTVSANISYSDYTSNGGGAMGTGSNRGGVILAVINTPTYAPVWDALNPNQYYNNFYGVGNITNKL